MTEKDERKPLGIAKCGVLDRNGRRCRATSVTAVEYHGTESLYSFFNGKPTWVAVLVCQKHADLINE